MGTLNIFKETLLMTVRSGGQPTQWSVTFEKAAGGELNVKGLSGVQPLFSFGKKPPADKLWYKISLKNAVDLAANALVYEVPTLKKPLQTAINLVEKPSATINKFLSQYNVTLNMMNGLADNPKYIGIQGETISGSF